MKIETRYSEALNRIPAPGGGGCHAALLGVANLGALAGLRADTVMAEIKANIPPGRRRVSDREIEDAVSKAFAECDPLMVTPHHAGRYQRPPPKPKPFDGTRYLAELIKRSAGVSEAELWEASPYRIDWEPGPRDALAVLDTLFAPTEIIYIGDTYGKIPAPLAGWRKRIEAGLTAPHICPNPFDGHEHETTTGTMSARCDAAVAAYRFAIVEFDDMTRQDQVQFWHSIIEGALLPVAALIDSGGKSIHAWLRVDLPDVAAWDQEIRQGLYDPETGRMALLGADRACQNPSRLSRLPGHYRREKGNTQRLLYLNPRAMPWC